MAVRNRAAISRRALRAISDLHNVSRMIQSSGSVRQARSIMECTDTLEEELRDLEGEKNQLIQSLSYLHAEEDKLRDRVAELQDALLECAEDE